MSSTLLGLLALAGGASLLLGLLSNALMRRWALRVGYVDRPGGHKSHADVMPYGGGPALLLSTWLPLTLALAAAALTPSESWPAVLGSPLSDYVGGLLLRWPLAAAVLAGALLLHVMGVFDDVRPLGATPKLLAMLLVAGAVTWLGGLRIAAFLGEPVSALLTLLWIATLTNAFNFLDNMDGLSAGVAAICLIFLGTCAALAGQVLVPLLASVLLGWLLSFLAFNFPPARMFMGDAGSLMVGFMVSVVSILTTYYDSGSPGAPYALLVPLIILAVPLYDFCSVVLIRLREGRSPLRGDQRHFSHRLVERGLSRRGAVLTIYLATCTTGLASTLLPGADLPRTLVIAGVVVCVLAIIAILESPASRTS